MIKEYTFEEDFLMEKFLKEEPQTLDDHIPDCFADWMERLDTQEVIDYAQEYADKCVEQAFNKFVKQNCKHKWSKLKTAIEEGALSDTIEFYYQRCIKCRIIRKI